jgi:hypothetical protein
MEALLRKTALAALCSVSLVLSGCATHYVVDPIAAENQELRYERGTPTTYSEGERGAVQITPFGVDERDGRLIFGVAAYNKAEAPSNFGLGNIRLATGGGQPIRTYSNDDLVREAQGRAGAAAFAVALIGLAAMVSAADGAETVTRGRAWTRHGPVRLVQRTYDPGSAVFGTIVAGAATGMALGGIRRDLDSTIAGIDDEILDTTTIYPDDSYGGIVVGDRLRTPTPQEVTVSVNFNGEDHLFRYSVARVQ